MESAPFSPPWKLPWHILFSAPCWTRSDSINVSYSLTTDHPFKSVECWPDNYDCADDWFINVSAIFAELQSTELMIWEDECWDCCKDQRSQRVPNDVAHWTGNPAAESTAGTASETIAETIVDSCFLSLRGDLFIPVTILGRGIQIDRECFRTFEPYSENFPPVFSVFIVLFRQLRAISCHNSYLLSLWGPVLSSLFGGFSSK